MLLGAFRTAFGKASRIVAASAIALVALAAVLWLPNAALLRIVLMDGAIGIGRKVALAATLLGSLATNFTPLAAASVVIASMLVGINAVLAYHLVRRMRGQGVGTAAAASGIGGIFAGILGAGCAACGSVLATAALGTVGGAGLLTILPFGGKEFGLVGLLLLTASTYALLRRIAEPLACRVGQA